MKRFKKWFMRSILMGALCAGSTGAVAGIVAIVNNANSSADKQTIGKLYSGEIKSWPDGTPAKLFDLSGLNEREEFCKAYTGKNAAAIKSAWAKAVFTGRATPPKMLDSDIDVKNEVAKDRKAVGYVNESSVDGSVRAVR